MRMCVAKTVVKYFLSLPCFFILNEDVKLASEILAKLKNCMFTITAVEQHESMQLFQIAWSTEMKEKEPMLNFMKIIGMEEMVKNNKPAICFLQMNEKFSAVCANEYEALVPYYTLVKELSFVLLMVF